MISVDFQPVHGGPPDNLISSLSAHQPGDWVGGASWRQVVGPLCNIGYLYNKDTSKDSFDQLHSRELWESLVLPGTWFLKITLIIIIVLIISYLIT